MKRRNCKVCGKYSGKRKVCLKCKTEQPTQMRGKGSNPFERKNEGRIK